MKVYRGASLLIPNGPKCGCSKSSLIALVNSRVNKDILFRPTTLPTVPAAAKSVSQQTAAAAAKSAANGAAVDAVDAPKATADAPMVAVDAPKVVAAAPNAPRESPPVPTDSNGASEAFTDLAAEVEPLPKAVDTVVEPEAATAAVSTDVDATAALATATATVSATPRNSKVGALESGMEVEVVVEKMTEDENGAKAGIEKETKKGAATQAGDAADRTSMASEMELEVNTNSQ